MEYSELVVSIVDKVIDEAVAAPMKEVDNGDKIHQIGRDKYTLSSIPAEKMAEFKTRLLAQNRKIDSLSPEERANRKAQFQKAEAERAEKAKQEQANG